MAFRGVRLECRPVAGGARRGLCSRSRVPSPVNEPIQGFLAGSPERAALQQSVKKLRATKHDIPLVINGKEVRTGKKARLVIPHDHSHPFGEYHLAGPDEVHAAIEASLVAKQKWNSLPWEHRAAVFLRIADLLAGPRRAEINAVTMLSQSKNMLQAEIDAACESIDFLRFNVHYAQQIYSQQPYSPPGMWNRLVGRPLEGFVYAVTPFNFTAIAANLACAPAIAGNTVLWKPSDSAILSGYKLMEVYKEAGLPDGVINFVPGDPAMVTDIALKHKDLAAISYTGSTQIFKGIWKKIGENIDTYKSYPRIVGETGGKDFIFAHNSALVDETVTAIVRGSFEYAGQKCSACSRAYIPESLWTGGVKDKLIKMVQRVKTGNPEDPSVLVNAVIHKRSFDKCKSFIDHAKQAKDAEVLVGGECNDSTGYFVSPTVIVTTNPHYKSMEEEIFGPIVTIYVYPDSKFSETLDVCDKTSPYGLTGSILARDRFAVEEATQKLKNAAGNFYINDKCTGSVVGQQPFGGARGSGTNDKAGFETNMHRWMSMQSIKETFVPAKDFVYPYMEQVD